MMKPLAYGIALALILQLIQSKTYVFVYYIGLVVVIGSNILCFIGYRNIGKRSYRYMFI